MSAKKKSEETPRRRAGEKTPGCASILAVVILIAIAIGLIYWFLPRIVTWSTATWDNLLSLFGAGMTLVAIYLFVIFILLLGKRLGLLAKYWNICVGIIALTLTAFGVMAFINADMGGTFGKGIIGSSPTTGILRLIGLAFLGILFLAPRQTWDAMLIMIKALGRAIWQLLLGIDRSIKIPAKSETANEPKLVQETPMEKVEPAKPSIPIPEPISPLPGMTPSITGATKAEPQEPIRLRPSLTVGGWQLPPINILDKPIDTDVSQADVKKRAEIIMESLSSYGVDAQVVQINVGPTVTQFGVEPGWDIKYKEVKEKDKDGNIKTKLQEVSKTRVKVERITSLANDLSLALAASSIRIEAPVPGKSIIGIEVPNSTFGSVNLRSIIESTSFQKICAKSRMAIGLGKGAGGETVSADLTKMPHLLIAGATGSGKTVYLNSIICCLLIFNTPDDLRFIMIDPKRVELVNFNALPHLIAPVVVETDKAVSALRWLTGEMDDRYRRFSQAGARNIEGYNKNRQPGEALPYIVLVIDELADLMMTAFDEVEHTLCRLAQLSRATGIHLIVATQRPSVDVVTGLIKANFPTRISFSLTSQVDSRTILDSAGAEKLLGRGDMLYMPTDASKPKRLQGPFLTDPEIDRLTNFWGNQRRPGAEPIKFEDVPATGAGADTDDTLLEAAKKLADEHEQISVSFLQRRLRIGYPRAARLYDRLKEEGFVEENK
jgi:S-DNA-T family DNA segregation ATPase FtsK/SpoIIIE